MPTVRLTDLSIKALKAPASGQTTFYDVTLTGFGIRVSKGGSKTFVVVYGEKRTRKTLGRYPLISLQDARELAKGFLAEHTLGKHRAPRIALSKAVEDFRKQYLDVHNEKQTAIDTERRLQNHVVPTLGSKNVEDTSRRDLSSIFGKLVEAQKYGAANHVFAATRLFFNWCRDQGYVEHSPMEGMRRPAPDSSRERVLSDNELRTIWKAATEDEGTFCRIVQLLMIHPQRRSEISGLRGEWIDTKEKVIVFPKTITKNRREHLVPYGNLFHSVLEMVGIKDGYLFPASGGESYFTGWSKGKKEFEKTCKLNQQWQLHDFRRTIDTNMSELGVAPHVVEKLLNHVATPNAIKGVSATYNRYGYFKEMREAVDLWESRFAKLIAA